VDRPGDQVPGRTGAKRGQTGRSPLEGPGCLWHLVHRGLPCSHDHRRHTASCCAHSAARNCQRSTFGTKVLLPKVWWPRGKSEKPAKRAAWSSPVRKHWVPAAAVQSPVRGGMNQKAAAAGVDSCRPLRGLHGFDSSPRACARGYCMPPPPGAGIPRGSGGQAAPALPHSWERSRTKAS